jgi:hypothetical protein
MTLWVSWLSKKLEMSRHRRCAPSPLAGEGWGEGLRSIDRPEPLTRIASQFTSPTRGEVKNKRRRCLKLNSVAAITRPRHSGAARRAEPGISRFRVRCGACHRAALCADPLASPRKNERNRHCLRQTQSVCARERNDEAIHTFFAARWIASRSPSSGAHSRDPLARNDEKSRLICPTGKSLRLPLRWLSSPSAKNISLSPSGKSSLQTRPVPSHSEGRCATSSTRGGMRWTQGRWGRAAQACGRQNRVVLTPRRRRQVRERQLSRATVTRKPDRRGERV